MRDLTRGGLASAIDEIARGSRCQIALNETSIPVHPEVQGACEVLGLDPLAMANEGRMIVIYPPAEEEETLTVLRRFQLEAARIGSVLDRWKSQTELLARYPVTLVGALGVERPLDLGSGEQLPRIC